MAGAGYGTKGGKVPAEKGERRAEPIAKVTVAAAKPLVTEGRSEREAEIAALRAKAAKLRERADRQAQAAVHAADHAPGAYVTGGSGRTRAQNRATERAIERTVRLSVESSEARAKARSLEAHADWIESTPRRRASREAAKKREKATRAAAAKVPVTNNPAAPYHMTSKEWASLPKDYRGTELRGGVRVRTALQPASRGGGLAEVYLTDKS